MSDNNVVDAAGEGVDPAEHEDPQGGRHHHCQQDVRKVLLCSLPFIMVDLYDERNYIF